ncbi:hypothetical protein [Amycolatopsis sp. NBC_01480]|uniref:hypothetical protein n=1 Tax=Amycolatopsis sp. NBC_01480 TaxID=2903562 RepID=UPI002E2E7477|nr:hypothetical protein [Amycolatopsis sp. NBC_01480]
MGAEKLVVIGSGATGKGFLRGETASGQICLLDEKTRRHQDIGLGLGHPMVELSPGRVRAAPARFP